MILDNVDCPQDVKKLTLDEKEELAEEIRKKILDVVSKNGGHLASNLGIVELTIAIHSCFDMPKDKVIWDVGHQSYVHKILTGRKSKFDTLRKKDGISGFPKTSESEYDSFDTGHSSTSISVALGMARARDILKKEHRVIAVIGDGALTGGMALEALNDAGISKTDMIVIINDNEMSISKNTGGVSLLLAKSRTNYFEDIGFKYIGPVDGHNISDLEKVFNDSKNLKGPVLIHVKTIKGKGYKFAEEKPDQFHSTSSFDIESGKKKKSGTKTYSDIFGEKIVSMASKNPKIVTVTAAMESGTGLTKFAEKYPDRFFDVEIAEQHSLGMVAGMAKEGLRPVIPIYSSFLQRGYDQLVHDISIQELPVVICVDRAGIVGNDGETHQGILDLSFLNTIPNMNIMAPKNFEELDKMLDFAVEFNKPIAIRYPRGGEGDYKFSNTSNIEFGKAELLKKGKDVTIFSIGKMTEKAMMVSEKLQDFGIDCEVINARFMKPIDKDLLLKSAMKTKRVVTIEDNIAESGLGCAVSKCLANENCKILNLGYPDKFIKHGGVSEIEDEYGLSVEKIKEAIIEFVSNKK